jgi:hypothetical protein
LYFISCRFISFWDIPVFMYLSIHPCSFFHLMSFQFVLFHFISLHFTSFHFIRLFVPFHFDAFHFISRRHSVRPSIHPCIHESMPPCIHASIHPSIHSFIHKPILGKLSIDPCVHWSRTAAEAAAASPCQRKRCIKMVQQAPWPTWCLQSCPNSKGKSAASCTVPRGRHCSGNSVDPPVHGLDNKWCSFHERGTALFLLLVPQKEKWHRPDKVVLANLCRKLFWTYICNVRPKYHDLLQTVSTSRIHSAGINRVSPAIWL